MRAVAAMPLSERQFQRQVTDLAHTLGYAVFHVGDSRKEVVGQDGARFLVGDREAAGWPDLVLVRERVIYSELKTDQGRLSPNQKRWIEVLLAAGQEVHVWRPRDWPSVVDCLTRRGR